MPDYRFRTRLAAVAGAGLIAASAALASPTAAAPTALVSAGSDARVTDIVVHSASMNRDIPLTVIKPADTSRPRGVLYLLNGAGGGEDNASWTNRSDIVEFTKNKNLYVVIPNKGAYSYYADWQKTDPVLGVNKWSTFLGDELPPVIDVTYNTNGRNAIAGISSSGTSVLNLAIAHPDRYEAVGSYSGCAGVADPIGQQNVRLVVEGRGNADATNMWGPYSGSGWRANDPVINAAKLRGTKLYISSSTGLPGEFDTPQYEQDGVGLGDQILLGGGIEAVTYVCTQQLVNRLRELNIPATLDLRPTGSHSWLYWQEQLHKSWPFFASAVS